MWAVLPTRLTERLEMFRAGALKPSQEARIEGQAPPPPFEKAGKIAVIPIHGEMMKGDSSFGGTTSTVRARKALRAAAADSSVGGIMLHIDSPGGTVAGTADLADDITAAQRSKPVHSHIADLGASAAYWVASQTGRVSTTRTSLVGSLGTMATLVDESGALDKMGIKVHVVSTGDHKGNGADGKVTDAMLGNAQRMVDDINQHFMAAVKSGREFSQGQTATLFDGRVHVGSEALGLGLVDAVSSFDDAMQNLNTEITKMDSTQFMAYAAENPGEVTKLAAKQLEQAHATGHAEGTKAERDRVAAIAGMKGDASILLAAIANGDEPAKVKDSLFDAQAKEIADLKAAIAKGTTTVAGQQPVTFVVSGSTNTDGKPCPDKAADPKGYAAWEFENGKTAWKASTKERYVAARAAELQGNLRIAS